MKKEGSKEVERQEFEELFNRYLNDGFENLDIELKNGSTIVFNSKNMLCRFLGGTFQIASPGLLIQVDYRAIKGIVIQFVIARLNELRSDK